MVSSLVEHVVDRCGDGDLLMPALQPLQILLGEDGLTYGVRNGDAKRRTLGAEAEAERGWHE